jgi:hypothetical protein
VHFFSVDDAVQHPEFFHHYGSEWAFQDYRHLLRAPSLPAPPARHTHRRHIRGDATTSIFGFETGTSGGDGFLNGVVSPETVREREPRTVGFDWRRPLSSTVRTWRTPRKTVARPRNWTPSGICRPVPRQRSPIRPMWTSYSLSIPFSPFPP